jgi:murein DD-endopeptidase MepM/ murein hydrolase activator NlpD
MQRLTVRNNQETAFFRKTRFLVLALVGLFLWTFTSSFSIQAAAPAQVTTPASTTIHVVASGETLYTIALRYRVTVEAIVAANELADPNRLRIGQELVIPSANANPTPAPTADSPVSQIGLPELDLCPENTRVYPLALPQEPIHLAAVGDALYAIADGALYQIPLPELAAVGILTPTALLPVERRIDDYWVQELVYATVEPESGDLLLLDKTNDIYRYTADGKWRMEYPAAPVPGQFPDPQYIAIQSQAGQVYALDSDLSRIWLLYRRGGPPRLHITHPLLLTGVDFRAEAGSFAVLTREGQLLRYRNGSYEGPQTPFPQREPATWPAYLLPLGGGQVGIVESEQRALLAVDGNSGEPTWRAEFRIPGMQRLRSAAVVSGVLYAIAASNLYAVELSPSSSVCPPVVYDNKHYFGGRPVEEILPVVELPFPSAVLPWRPRSYPGARRLYRYGVHNGLDLYGLDVAGLGIGSTVRAIADGVVIQADNGYVEMTPAQYEAAIIRTDYEHRTPPEMEDLFLGRQVQIEHRPNVESRYSHLGGIAQGISATVSISQGIPVGFVGVSGTSSGAYGTNDGAHLHFEIWVDGRYLGQGLNLEETMRLWRWLFDADRATAQPTTAVAAPTATPSPPSTAAMEEAEIEEPSFCQRPPDLYERVTFRGELLNERTLWMLRRAAELYTGRGDPLRVTQGSYSTAEDASFGTHAGGGAVDISIRVKSNPQLILSEAEANELVIALRQAGFAAWLRLPNDLTPPVATHIHAVAIGDAELSPEARRQIDGPEGYFRGLDGVIPEFGGPHADRHGGPVICNWMVTATYEINKREE